MIFAYQSGFAPENSMTSSGLKQTYLSIDGNVAIGPKETWAKVRGTRRCGGVSIEIVMRAWQRRGSAIALRGWPQKRAPLVRRG